MAALFDKLNSGKNDCGDMEKLLGWQYPHERTAALPSKTSISEIKRRWQEDEHAEEPDILPELKPPVFAESGAVLTGAARGTAYHSFMEHTDFSYKNTDDVENAKKRMVTDGILTEEEANAVRPEKILAFLQSDLCARIKRSPDVRRETAFTLGLTPYELYRDEIYKDDREIINVDGIIDLFFEEDGDIVLVDYKTDRLDGGIAAVVSRYSIQLELYAMAIERALGKKVKQKLLYLFAADTAVEL